MKNLITKATNAARKFTAFDFSILKIYLCAIGILLGSYFSAFFMEHICIVWIVAVIAFVIVMVQMLRYSCNCDCDKNK